LYDDFYGLKPNNLFFHINAVYIMTHEEFLSIVRHPEKVRNDHMSDLKELVDLYPYFTSPRLFHVKALKQSNSIQFAANLKVASLYCTSRRWLYFYLYPEKTLSLEPYRREKLSKSGGDYFDMITTIEAECNDSKQSLKNLAEKLKLAREVVGTSEIVNHMQTNNFVKESPMAVILNESNVDFDLKPKGLVFSEDNAKKLIQERKYSDAIEILRALNLNNPKKSVYFADQIRFLEKVIGNSKK